MKRQQFRILLLLIAFLLFPITMWYFSPALIIMGAMEHIINGSLITFALMLLTSTFLGRFFCGYLCPAGGLQECTALVNDKNPKKGWRIYVKYVLWLIWLIAIIACYLIGKGNIRIDPFYNTDHGISIADRYSYIIYYIVLLLIFVPSVLFGKRAFCHYICWMAPFMEIGSKLGRLLHIPQIHISSEKEHCISCKQCDKKCPMSLDVMNMAKEGSIEDIKCIQCAACVDSCPKKILRYTFKK